MSVVRHTWKHQRVRHYFESPTPLSLHLRFRISMARATKALLTENVLKYRVEPHSVLRISLGFKHNMP